MRVGIAAVVLAATFIFAGCGDDDDGDDREALSEEEFIEQANAICAAGEERLEAAREEIRELPDVDPTDERIVELASGAADELRDRVDDIRNLNGPPELEERLDPILDAVEQRADDVEINPLLLQDEATVDAFDTALGALGLTECP